MDDGGFWHDSGVSAESFDDGEVEHYHSAPSQRLQEKDHAALCRPVIGNWGHSSLPKLLISPWIENQQRADFPGICSVCYR
jgi:hypothetical protein